MTESFFKFRPQYMPLTKTPWGGSQIVELKKKYLNNALLPERIGESYEAQFDRMLLKWIDAVEPLSVQIHPDNSNPLLNLKECGKPEAWFVKDLFQPTPLYLGFKEGYSKADIEDCLQSNNPLACLHSFLPNKNDYIFIPTGCVHALGAGVLIAEPQRIVPGKEGKTWRIFDWNRAYNEQGSKDVSGKPRELHIEQALTAIDWKLPRGKALEKTLVKSLNHGDRFLGNSQNPFCIELFLEDGYFPLRALVPNRFSFITVFEGEVNVSDEHNTLMLSGGETGFIPPLNKEGKLKIQKKFQKAPCVLIFALAE